MAKESKKAQYPEIEDIRDDLNSLRSNVVELTKHIKEDKLVQTQELNTRFKDRWTKFQASGQEQYKNVEKRVKEKPAQSMAVAFAAGLAASIILRRR